FCLALLLTLSQGTFSAAMANGPTPHQQAQAYTQQGTQLLLQSRPADALEAFTAATEHYITANDLPGILQSQIHQAQALQALGFYRRALFILTDLPVPLTEQADSLTKVTGLQLLGNLHRSIGDLAASQTALTDGLTAAQAINHPDAIASLQLSLGHTAEANRDPDSALRSYQQATTSTDPSLRLRAQLSQLALLNNTVVNSTAADSTATADALYRAIESTLTTAPLTRTTLNARLDFARQQLDHGQLATAIADNLAIAHRQAQTLNDSRATAYALGYLGELYLSQQQLTDAESALQQALAIANDLQAPDLAYQWQWQLGRLYRQQGDISQAIAQYESATKSLDSLRGNLIAIAPDLRFDFREKVEPVYREWVDLLLSEPTPAQTKSTTAQNLTKARAAIESLQLAELENYFQEPCVPVSQQIDQVIENAASPTAV
ncbi:MAG: tetratricopeptide repeat protein, partial [Cyanobacteria bacterium J06607_10]